MLWKAPLAPPNRIPSPSIASPAPARAHSARMPQPRAPHAPGVESTRAAVFAMNCFFWRRAWATQCAERRAVGLKHFQVPPQIPPGAFDPASAGLPAPDGRFVVLSRLSNGRERDDGRFSPMLMAVPSDTVGLSCGQDATRCCCSCWTGCCCCGSRHGSCPHCCSNCRPGSPGSSPMAADRNLSMTPIRNPCERTGRTNAVSAVSRCWSPVSVIPPDSWSVSNTRNRRQ